jgi:hypothetical protein
VVGKTARCHWRFPLALHILLHPNRQRSGVQCLKDVRISSVPPAGALGLTDDFGNAKCGPSFPRPDPASSEGERTARGRRDMSCRFPGPLRLLGWALTHASRLKLRSRLCQRGCALLAGTPRRRKSVRRRQELILPTERFWLGRLVELCLSWWSVHAGRI